MNKKFFAALASATMAFSATGSLAVFAQDFVDETQQNVPGTGDNYSEVNLYDVMDYKLIDAVKKAYDDTNAGKTLDPAHALKSQLNTITALELKDSTTGNATGYAGQLKDVEDFRGIEYLTKLTTFSLSAATGQPASNATTVDLSENSELETVIIESDKLADLELPVESKLTTLTVSGATQSAPIHKLDFRGFSETATAVTIDVKNTGLVKADLSGVTALTTASFTDSPIFSVNVNGLSSLESLTVARTKLKKLDVTTNKKLTTLILNDNHLDELDLSNNKKLASLNIDNNYFASIDLTNNKALNTDWAAPEGGQAGTGNQTLYTSAAYDTVDLTGLKGFVLKNSGISEGETSGKYAGLTPVPDEDGEPTGVCKLTGTTHSYQYDGTGAFDSSSPLLHVTIDNNAELMNRLYNPNSGEHFYTKDLNEKDVLTGLGWVDEGIGWVAPLKTDANEPVYRLYNPNAGDHHYTRDLNEKTFLVAHGWKDEGIGWYSLPDNATKKLPLFRQYNPNATGAGSHNYTTDVEENDFLVNIGWNAEGFAWNALK